MTDESGAPELPHIPADNSSETNEHTVPAPDGIGSAAVESTFHTPGTTFEPTAETQDHNSPNQPPNETSVAPESNAERAEAPVINKMIGNIQSREELTQEEKDHLTELVKLVDKEAPLEEQDPESLKSQVEKIDQTTKDVIRTLLIVDGYRKVIGEMGAGLANRPLGVLRAVESGGGKYDLGRVIGEVNLQSLAVIRRNIGVLLGSRMPEEGDFERNTQGPAWTGGVNIYDGRSSRPWSITDRSEVPSGGLGLGFREIRNINTMTGEVGVYSIIVDPAGWPENLTESPQKVA